MATYSPETHMSTDYVLFLHEGNIYDGYITEVNVKGKQVTYEIRVIDYKGDEDDRYYDIPHKNVASLEESQRSKHHNATKICNLYLKRMLTDFEVLNSLETNPKEFYKRYKKLMTAGNLGF